MIKRCLFKNYSSTCSISSLTIKSTALFINSSAFIKITTQKSFDLKECSTKCSSNRSQQFTPHVNVQQHQKKKIAVLRTHYGVTAERVNLWYKKEIYFFLNKEILLWETAVPLMLDASTRTRHATPPTIVWRLILQDETLFNLGTLQTCSPICEEPGCSSRGPQAFWKPYLRTG